MNHRFKKLLCTLGLHEWAYTDVIYMSEQAYHLALPSVTGKRKCKCCGKEQIESRVCLGLNPPAYYTK